LIAFESTQFFGGSSDGRSAGWVAHAGTKNESCLYVVEGECLQYCFATADLWGGGWGGGEMRKRRMDLRWGVSIYFAE
jgi:hypothetical protein